MANGKILREGIFDDIWIQPAAGDAGGALGAALFTWHQVMDKPAHRHGEGRDSQKGSYLGPAFDADGDRAWLKDEGIPYERHEPEAIPQLVADLLGDEKVVGWFSGRMEFGPRALGATQHHRRRALDRRCSRS